MASMHKIKIKQILSRPVIVVAPDTPALEAVAVMARSSISCLVVVEDGKPVGIFTERDVVKVASRSEAFDLLPIRSMMTTPVFTIPGSLSLYEAYNLMLTNGIRHHVIVDAGGAVAGVLSQSDLIDHLGLQYFVEMRKIRQIMSGAVVTVAEDLPVRQALLQMAAANISCVVVAKGERPLGVITERDVARLVSAGTDLDATAVAGAMTAPVHTLPGDATVQNAALTMKQHGIRRVVVVDEAGLIAGVVTQSDIVKGLERQYVESLKKAIGDREDVLRETARELLDKSIYLDAILSSSIGMAIVATDVEFQIKYFNPVAEKVFGYSAEEAIGRSALELQLVTRAVPARLLKMADTVKRHGEYHFPLKIDGDDGTCFYEGRVTGIRDRLDRLAGFVMMLRDVTEGKRYEEKIRHLAYHDALTGLPNRVLLGDRVSQALAQASRNGNRGALMILDLDNFKDTNDTFGHSIGDLLLQSVSARLKELVRKSDTVSRMGGDEFVLLFSSITSQEGADFIARKIVKAFSKPFDCAGQNLQITTSIGISIFPDDGVDEETLLKKADIALYQAKEQGRNAFRQWTGSQDRELREG
jgi:diguanylate cyclase (GGDEF)-like protein/PAS domain S-box-containing protein